MLMLMRMCYVFSNCTTDSNVNKGFLMKFRSMLVLASSVSAFVLAGSAAASPYPSTNEEDVSTEKVYSPYAGADHPDKVLFGDVHHHTKLSPDAGLLGTTLTAQTVTDSRAAKNYLQFRSAGAIGPAAGFPGGY